jgi:thiol-disulfide isomerase/thioredoxin
MKRISYLPNPWLSVGILLLGAAWIALSAPPQGTTQGRIPAPRQGFLAPPLSLAALDGSQFDLQGLRGSPVLLNFWASWCPPCKAEMPAMEEIYRAYRDAGFIVLAVNVTSQDSQSAAAAFAADYSLTFPILLDLDGAVSRLYQARSLPATYFIDRQGIIQEVVIGGPMSEALLRTRVEKLLEEAAP